MDEAIAWPLLLGVLGLVFGSFIATVAIRWPQGRSALSGRSMCDACGATLNARELVPVASYLVQRGRCRSCGAAIAPGHLMVELAGGAIGIAAGMLAPGWEGAAGALFGWLLLALATIDLAAFWLPNELTGALALGGVATGLLHLPPHGPPLDARLLGGAAGYASLQIVRLAYRALRRREGLGGGDPKLFGAIGLWLGWQALAPVLLIACLIGLAAVLAFRLGGRRMRSTDRVPLGVLLAISAWTFWVGTTLDYATRPAGPVILLVPQGEVR